jgi:hypothetical protein
MTCLFLADKDCDDFTKKRLRSSHLIYTPTYDIEGHLFSCGNVSTALSDACGITTDHAKSLLPNPKVWLETVATNWKEWVALCMVSQSRGVNIGCTFERPSQVNPDPFGPPDMTQVSSFKAKLTAAVAATLGEIETEFRIAIRKIEQSIRAGHPLRYFKGKWLGHLIQRHLENNPKIPDANISGVGERLNVALVSQVAVHTNCSCCAAYVPQLNSIVVRMKSNL